MWPTKVQHRCASELGLNSLAVSARFLV